METVWDIVGVLDRLSAYAWPIAVYLSVRVIARRFPLKTYND